MNRRPRKTHCIHGHLRTPENLTPLWGCKMCAKKRSHDWLINNRKRTNATKAAWRKTNEEKYGNYQRRWRYRITKEQIEERLRLQGGKCLGCGKLFSKVGKKNVPNVDHDHSCCPGKIRCGGNCIRGLLCFNCNAILGHAQDNVAQLKALINYLEVFREIITIKRRRSRNVVTKEKK